MTNNDTSTGESSSGKNKLGLKTLILIALCTQKFAFTVLRRYSVGILKENYSKYEVLLASEVIKIFFSAGMVYQKFGIGTPDNKFSGKNKVWYLTKSSGKMILLAFIYGAMNILAYISLQNIGAGMYTIIAQCKLLSTAVFSVVLLKRSFSWARWRSFIVLVLGVMLFSEPMWKSQTNNNESQLSAESSPRNSKAMLVGMSAVWFEVALCGFASVYFEKVIKTGPMELDIWELNFQLGLGSVPIYMFFLITERGGSVGFLHGWSIWAVLLSLLGACGGMLVALSLKHADSILKTIATTGAIMLIALFDHYFLGGPLTLSMMMSCIQVVIAICNYTFDSSQSNSEMPKQSSIKCQSNERPEKSLQNL